MPLDGPLWHATIAPYTDSNGKPSSIVMFKAHHSFADGISVMSMCLYMSAEYDRSFLIKTIDATFFQKIFIKLMVVYYIPYLTIKNLLLRPDINFITKNKD